MAFRIGGLLEAFLHQWEWERQASMQARRDGISGGISAGTDGKADSIHETSIPQGPTFEVDFPSGPEFEAGAHWQQLVEQVRRGDDAAMQELYRVFENGIRFYFFRQFGFQEQDDKMHDTFLIVVQAIQSGGLREPERLMGFVRTVVRRQVAAGIEGIVQSRRDEPELGLRLPDRQRDPEQRAAFEERVQLMRRILKELCPQDRDILTRYYLHEETQELICHEMKLTDNQFRLLKSRAKARFGGLGRLRLRQRRGFDYFGQTSPSAPQ